MKNKIVRGLICIAAVGFMACNNDTTEAAKPAPEAKKPAATAPVKVEPKTEVSVNPNGAEVETKKVKVKVDTRDTLKK